MPNNTLRVKEEATEQKRLFFATSRKLTELVNGIWSSRIVGLTICKVFYMKGGPRKFSVMPLSGPGFHDVISAVMSQWFRQLEVQPLRSQ